MYTLGIETSCDETAASIVKNGNTVLSNVISSSINFHKKYGGIIPEIASRRQLETITQVVDSSISQAGIKFKQIGLVCVTNGPGLLGSLLVGISFAKSLSYALRIPLLGVNHVYAHIYASFFSAKKISLPFIALVISGGHSNLFLVNDFDEIKLLGQTQDDASGEAFDKVAKILGLSYPGGPVIEKLASDGDCRKIKFNCSDTKNPLNFSFSGIKTAVLYYVRKHPSKKASGVKDISASFQKAVIDVLINKTFLACRMQKSDRLVIGGGVAANNRLRQRFIEQGYKEGVEVFFPEKKLCTDNAAMAAGFGYQLYKKGFRSGLDLNMMEGDLC